MDRIGTIIPKVLKKRGLQKHAAAAQVVVCAQSWLEQNLPTVCADLQVTTLKNAELFITAAHSIAAQECQQVLPALREYITEQCSENPVEQIRIVRS